MLIDSGNNSNDSSIVVELSYKNTKYLYNSYKLPKKEVIYRLTLYIELMRNIRKNI